MKPLILTTLALPAVAQAQNNTEFVGAIKMESNEQTSATQVSLSSYSDPYGIDLDVEDGPTLSPAPVVSGPITMGEPFHNGGVLGFSPGDGWGYGYPEFLGYSAGTLNEIDSLFGSGTYTFDVAGVQVPLNLTGDLWPSTTPTMTLTGGYWAGGIYYLEESQPLFVTTSVYAEFGANVEDALLLDIWGDDFEQEIFELASWGGANYLSMNVPAGSLTAGNEYEVDSSFIALSDWSLTIPSLPNAMAAAGYERSTELRLMVVPDCGSSNYCTAVANSTGQPSSISSTGSLKIHLNDLHLTATNVPAHMNGVFVYGAGQAQAPFGFGFKCIDEPVYRMDTVQSDSAGMVTCAVDYYGVHVGGLITAGSTWNFQYWHRDPAAGAPAFNTSDGLTVTFCP